MHFRTNFLSVISILLAIICGVLAWFLFQRQSQLEYEHQQIKELSAQQPEKIVTEPAQVIEHVVTSAQLWRPVQEQIIDTVAQVFVQAAATDLLQPYKTPTQGGGYGSGFFINEQGDFITNAHVVSQAKSVYVQIPSLGKRIIDMEVVGISPERDLALLRITPESLTVIQDELGQVPYLSLGDSDMVLRSDEVLALGYPLGQHSLKSTTGVVSGRERHLIQMSAAINPGSSGGPLLNAKGEVVGINSSGFTEAQNIGYAIPINDLKIVLPDLYKVKILRKPFLGVMFNNATSFLTEYLGNPAPGGTYVVEVVKDSILDRVGVKRGDMIYEINEHKVDVFGEMSASWSEDKISLIDYVSRLSIGENVKLVVYRKGVRKEFTVEFSLSAIPAVHKIYPGYESFDYEVFGGMVVMELTLNHIQLLGEQATGLSKYAELKNQGNPVIIITHIFSNSQLHRSRVISVGTTINEVNGVKIKSLEDYRKAIKKGVGEKFLTILGSDNVSRASDNIFVALPYDKILKEETKISRDNRYPLSDLAQELLRTARLQEAVGA